MRGQARIFYWNIGYGTHYDVSVLQKLAEQREMEPCRFPMADIGSRRERLRNLIRSAPRRRAQVNLFLQHAYPEQFRMAEQNILIPNQEHTERSWLKKWRGLTFVACKTRYAQKLFAAEGLDARFIGFPSRDEQQPVANRDPWHFLHVSGSSALKGTFRILEVWKRHPEWPKLTVTRRFPTPGAERWARNHFEAANIEIIAGHLSDERVLELKNGAGVHLCMSESEGFGHYLMGALSTGAVVLATDGPPMNEIVTAECGIPVAVERAEPTLMGDRFKFSQEALEVEVERLVGMDRVSLQALGRRGRAQFERLNQEFWDRTRVESDTFFGAPDLFRAPVHVKTPELVAEKEEA